MRRHGRRHRDRRSRQEARQHSYVERQKCAAIRLAKQDGVSLNQWIAAAVAQKIGVVETAAVFLRRRAGDIQPSDMLEFLDGVPDTRPRPDDAADGSGPTVDRLGGGGQ